MLNMYLEAANKRPTLIITILEFKINWVYLMLHHSKDMIKYFLKIWGIPHVNYQTVLEVQVDYRQLHQSKCLY